MAPPRSARSVICQDPRRAITVSLDLSPLQQRIASHAASAQRVDAPRHGAPALRETPRLTACERVYLIGFGEGAPHLHLHLIPRCAADPASAAWSVADLYRAVAAGVRPPADPAAVRELVARARELVEPALLNGPPAG